MITQFKIYENKNILSDIIKIGDYVSNVRYGDNYPYLTKTIYIWRVTNIKRKNNSVFEINLSGVVWWQGEKKEGEKSFTGEWNNGIELVDYFSNKEPIHNIDKFNKKCKLFPKEKLEEVYADIESKKYNL